MEAVAQFLAQTHSDPSISYLAGHCRSLLRLCKQVPSLKEDEWAENRLAEFNLWAANSGVFAGEKASLDSRLALQQDVKSVIISLLTMLAESLIQCHYIGRNNAPSEHERSAPSSDDKDEVLSDEGIPPPTAPELIPRAFSPWSDDSSIDSDDGLGDGIRPPVGQPQLDIPKSEVAQAINHLARLSLAIRKSGANSQSQKADRRFKPAAHATLRRHLNYVVLAKGTEEGRVSYDVDAAGLTPVQERLIVANLRRRNRYLYAQRHSRKLAFEPLTHVQPSNQDEGDWPVFLEDGDQPTKADETKELTSETLNDGIDQPAFQYTELQMELHIPVLTATSASAATQPIDPAFIHNATPSQVAKTNITSTTAKIVYPKPPPMAEGVRYFKCPCCCQALPEMYRQNTLWKKHLIADICPYTCIIEDCPTPNQLFVTRNEWTRHVEKDHQQCWQCFACTTSGKAPLVFPSVEGFLEHLRQVHSNTITEEQYSTIIPEAARSVPAGISRCPLCDSNGPADSGPLLDHIAEHLHAFSLRSLPWPGNDFLDDNDDIENDENDYFNENDYFEQGSDVESRQDNPNSGSDRDSEGLLSLHSSQTSERPAIASESGSDRTDRASLLSLQNDKPVIPIQYDSSRGTPLELDRSLPPQVHRGPVKLPHLTKGSMHPGTLEMLERVLESMSASKANKSYPFLLNTPYIDRCDPLEVSQLLPEVVDGDWPQLCPPVFIPKEDPELNALHDRLLKLMLHNHYQRVENHKPSASIQRRDVVLSEEERFETMPLIHRARIRKSQGSVAEATELQTQAIAVLKRQIGPLHPKRLEYIDELAVMLHQNGKSEEVKVMLQQEAQLDNLGADEWLVTDAEYLLDGGKEFEAILCRNKLFQEAEQLHQKILDFLSNEAQLGDARHFTLRATEQLSNFLGMQSRWKLVVELEEGLLTKYSTSHSSNSPTTLRRKARLAWAIWSLGEDRKRAIALQKQVVSAWKEVMEDGRDDRGLASMDVLFKMHVAKQQIGHAIDVKIEEASIRMASNVKDDAATATCLSELAELYDKEGKEKDARKASDAARWLLLDPENRRGSMPPLPGGFSQTGRLTRRLRFWRR